MSGAKEKSFGVRLGDWFMERIEKATKEIDAAAEAEAKAASAPIAPAVPVEPVEPAVGLRVVREAAPDRSSIACRLVDHPRFHWRERMAIKGVSDVSGRPLGRAYVTAIAHAVGGHRLTVKPCGETFTLVIFSRECVLDLDDAATIGILLSMLREPCDQSTFLYYASESDLEGEKIASALLKIWG